MPKSSENLWNFLPWVPEAILAQIGTFISKHSLSIFTTRQIQSRKQRAVPLTPRVGNFRKSSEISANFRKLRKRFKPVFEQIKIFGKSSEMDVIANVHNGSQELKSFGVGFEKSSNGPQTVARK